MNEPSVLRRRLIKGGAVLAGLAAAGAAAGSAVMASPPFGAAPAGERLRRIQSSSAWIDGAFRNQVPLETSAEPRSRLEIMGRFLTDRSEARFPPVPIPNGGTDLRAVPEDALAWLGHSGFFIRLAGTRILIDPAVTQAFPFPGFYEPFAGADLFRPENLPSADLLLITHDHYDHLDCAAATALRSRVRHAVCPLGVGAHLERWGWEPERITELDWRESFEHSGVRITAVPAQHFSGRTFRANQTLWAGFVIEAQGFRIYHSGDTSMGPHFEEIRRTFGAIDLALLEDGQYDADWPGVHLLPPAWKRAAEILGPRAVMPIHNGKFSISHHAWNDPFENALRTAGALGLRLETPLIGEVLPLDPALRRPARAWWREMA